jgi:hypothetical protein
MGSHMVRGADCALRNSRFTEPARRMPTAQGAALTPAVGV